MCIEQDVLMSLNPWRKLKDLVAGCMYCLIIFDLWDDLSSFEFLSFWKNLNLYPLQMGFLKHYKISNLVIFKMVFYLTIFYSWFNCFEHLIEVI